ncbi:MAG: sigma-70 family RNA polymerase sigma factor [Elusimicrobiaceae bacterium]
MDFPQIYEEYFDRIYAYIRCRVNSVCAAEDIAMQVFKNAYKKSAQYDSARGNIAQWLFGIARNETNYHLRMAVLRTFFPLDIFDSDIASTETTVLDALVAEEDILKLKSALEVLNTRERELVTLKFYSELNNREIAKLTGLGESNVGTTLCRAMAKLRQTFGRTDENM